jgi:hypothetical protein
VDGTPNPAIHGGSNEIMLEFGIRQSIKVASIIGAKLVGGPLAPPTCDLSDGAHASERSCFVPLSSPLYVTFCRVLLARQGFDRQSSPRDVVSLRASWRCRFRSKRKQRRIDCDRLHALRGRVKPSGRTGKTRRRRSGRRDPHVSGSHQMITSDLAACCLGHGARPTSPSTTCRNPGLGDRIRAETCRSFFFALDHIRTPRHLGWPAYNT